MVSRINFDQFHLNFHLLTLEMSAQSRYGVVSCLGCLLPSKVDTLDSGHDIKLGPSAGVEYSHLRCVQLCSSVRAEGAQS